MNRLYRKAEWAEFPRSDRGEYINNPFCGFYRIYRFDISRGITHEDYPTSIENSRIATNQSLALVEINLKEYSDVPLSSKAIINVKRIFSLFSNLNMQMIVRFLYDWDGVCIQTEPKTIESIIEHMEQLSPILKEFAAHIYIMQGLFIGNWGEMHGGKFTNQNSIYRLYSVLKKCVDDNTYLAVRCPALWRMILKSYDPPTDWNDKGLIKLSLYNDGMMASNTDYGTYGNVHKDEAKSLDDKLYREYEIKFQNKLCQFVPNGGEVVNNCTFNDFNEAVETLKATRVSYLNGEYDEDVLNKWKSVILSGNWGSWKGKTGYDFIACHIGYRYVIKSVQVYENIQRSGYLHIDVQLNNVGYACCYRKLKIYFAIWGDNSTVKKESEIAADSRLWQPNLPVKLSCDIDASSFLVQKVRIGIRITDNASGANIQLADSFVQKDSSGYNMLGVYTPKEVID